MKALLLTLALLTGAAQAGRPCEAQLPQAASVASGLQLAERTARALDASGAEVVVLARAGQDLSRWGQRWSHLAFAYRVSPPKGPEATPRFVMANYQAAEQATVPGVWRVVHKLNHCGSDRAALYRQGLAEFFLDSPHRYEAAYAVLEPGLQRQLLPLLQDGLLVARWHERRYNLVAYPWATRYQQSNQWLLETLAGAAEPGANDRRRAQAWLQFKGYQPGRLHIDSFTRLGARLTKANVAFDDHPSTQRFAGRIDTVTADSVFRWLPAAGLAEVERHVR
jgi:hypothetical protein